MSRVEFFDGRIEISELGRKTVVDLKRQTIAVETNFLYLYKRHYNFSFRQIVGVAYGAKVTSGDGANDTYVIGLRTVEDEEIRIASFTHSGTDATFEGIGRWLGFEPKIDDSAKSRNLVNYLSKAIGVAVIPYRHIGW